MNSSIQSRLIFSASIILFCFLGLAGFVLDTAYQKGAQTALNDRLQIHLYSILGKAEVSKNNRLVMPSNLSEPRFSQVYSGLYAYIFNHKGDVVWRSSSSAGETIQAVSNLKPGQKKYIQNQSNGGASVELHYKAILDNAFSEPSVFEFVVIESTSGVDNQIAGFRYVLWQWLGGIGLLLIIIQFWIIRMNLKPLRHIVEDLEKIQTGDAEHLGNHYSDELKDIANTLNRLIDNERTHLKRYRNTLADLAHSLKTPLSVLTGIYEQANLDKADQKTIENQTLIMKQLVDYQLQKAAAKGHQTLMLPLNLESIINQLTSSLDKVYIDKKLTITTNIDKAIKFNAEKGDMFELFGNLLDNAYKWANTSVRVDLQMVNNNGQELRIIIEDDGPGILTEEIDNVLQRGIRADEATHGHGIGLAVVNELVSLYGGSLTSLKSSLGGQKWIILLPNA
ncbi:MAG: ATP-binding protein [Cycloclasticus sp.]|jgi:two-component system sensor histidine kinase PhoQ|nr:ATP-binding protein [Cycloclasticus sp.]